MGLDEAATQVAVGVIAGLYDGRDAGDGTVLGEAGGDEAARELADEAVRALRKAGPALRPEALEERYPDWDGLL